MAAPIHFVHQSLWQRLRERDPGEISKRALIEFDGHRFLIPFLGDLYAVDPQGEFLVLKGPEPSAELQVSVIEYLLGAKEIESLGRWVMMKDLKGGRGFAQSHPLPLEGIMERFGRDREGFVQKGRSLGGKVFKFGDASILLKPLPRIPMLFVLWEGDEEFPPRLNVLFDPTATEHMRLDALYGLAVEVCRRYSS